MLIKTNQNKSISKKNLPYMAKFLNPQAIVSGLDINWGMSVAHFGCGSGYFTLAIAQKVGPDGHVYAFDILKEKLEALVSHASLLKLKNIIAKRANLEKKGGSSLGDESQDWVVLVNMLYQSKQKGKIIQESCRTLKKGGCILVIDWKNFSGIGPDRGMRVSKQELIKHAKKNKLKVEDIEISNFHFGMILKK